MWIKTSKQTPEDIRRRFITIGGFAQIALVLGVILSRLDLPNLDFLIGILYGFSAVGNLAYLAMVGKHNIGGQNDRLG